MLQYLFNYLDIIAQINLKKTNKKNYKKLEIINFYDIPLKIKWKLNDEIIQKYPKIIKLDASMSKNLTDIKCLIELRRLNISWNINQIGENSLMHTTNLKVLNCFNNKKIKNIPIYNCLKRLHVG